MLKFQPKTEKQLDEEKLAPDGDYDFEVLEAAPATSGKGNPMIKIKLGVYNGEAIRWHITDYLLEAMGHKLRHFCDTTGLLAAYEAGSLCADDCKGRAGRVRLVIEEDKNGKYPPKNSVDDYIIRPVKAIAKAEPKPAAEPAQDDGSSDVPF